MEFHFQLKTPSIPIEYDGAPFHLIYIEFYPDIPTPN